jgi:hypothetical protein
MRCASLCCLTFMVAKGMCIFPTCALLRGLSELERPGRHLVCEYIVLTDAVAHRASLCTCCEDWKCVAPVQVSVQPISTQQRSQMAVVLTAPAGHGGRSATCILLHCVPYLQKQTAQSTTQTRLKF